MLKKLLMLIVTVTVTLAASLIAPTRPRRAVPLQPRPVEPPKNDLEGEARPRRFRSPPFQVLLGGVLVMGAAVWVALQFFPDHPQSASAVPLLLIAMIGLCAAVSVALKAEKSLSDSWIALGLMATTMLAVFGAVGTFIEEQQAIETVQTCTHQESLLKAERPAAP